MKIVPISESCYLKYEGCRRIIHHDNARAFAEVDIGQRAGSFALAWRSDLVVPTAVANRGMWWVGIDQKIAAIQEQTGRICFSMTLIDNLSDILFGDRVVIIACETEILVLNDDYSIREIHGVPDGIKAVRMTGNRLEITTLENVLSKIDL